MKTSSEQLAEMCNNGILAGFFQFILGPAIVVEGIVLGNFYLSNYFNKFTFGLADSIWFVAMNTVIFVASIVFVILGLALFVYGLFAASKAFGLYLRDNKIYLVGTDYRNKASLLDRWCGRAITPVDLFPAKVGENISERGLLLINGVLLDNKTLTVIEEPHDLACDFDEKNTKIMTKYIVKCLGYTNEQFSLFIELVTENEDFATTLLNANYPLCVRGIFDGEVFKLEAFRKAS